MHILVTNDDGVNAPGLLALTVEMRKLGQVTVLAPDRNWSASGHVKTMHRPLRVMDVILADGSPALACDGAPSDCVALALLGLIAEKIDLVVSGINPNANVGHDVTYSGTVTAAMEAAIWGIPGLAFSLDPLDYPVEKVEYSAATRIAGRISRLVGNHGLPKGSLLNINIPGIPEQDIRGYQVTRQGLRVYRDQLDKRNDPRGKPYYWIGGEAPTGIPEEGTDVGALAAGYVSITPLDLDLTACEVIEKVKEWNWSEG